MLRNVQQQLILLNPLSTKTPTCYFQHNIIFLQYKENKLSLFFSFSRVFSAHIFHQMLYRCPDVHWNIFNIYFSPVVLSPLTPCIHFLVNFLSSSKKLVNAVPFPTSDGQWFMEITYITHLSCINRHKNLCLVRLRTNSVSHKSEQDSSAASIIL